MRRILAAVCFLLAIAACWAWYEFYFRWRDCFNEEGRCFDSATGVVYHAQSGPAWGLAALVFLLAAAYLWMRGGR